MTVAGTFLPWECYRGILDLCFTGLYVNWSAIWNAHNIQLMLIAFTPAALYKILNTKWQFPELWRIIAITLISSGFIFIILEINFLEDGGGLKFFLGSMIAVWAMSYTGLYAKGIVIGIPLIMTTLGFYNLIQYFSIRSFEYFTPVADWQGRLWVFLGSLLMLSAGLWWRSQPNQ